MRTEKVEELLVVILSVALVITMLVVVFYSMKSALGLNKLFLMR